MWHDVTAVTTPTTQRGAFAGWLPPTLLRTATPSTTSSSDTVELSEAAKQSDADDPIRTERLRDLRDQIAAGRFLTPERLDGTVELLYRQLHEQG